MQRQGGRLAVLQSRLLLLKNGGGKCRLEPGLPKLGRFCGNSALEAEPSRDSSR